MKKRIKLSKGNNKGITHILDNQKVYKMHSSSERYGVTRPNTVFEKNAGDGIYYCFSCVN
jgi:hypothetical protein